MKEFPDLVDLSLLPPSQGAQAQHDPLVRCPFCRLTHALNTIDESFFTHFILTSHALSRYTPYTEKCYTRDCDRRLNEFAAPRFPFSGDKNKRTFALMLRLTSNIAKAAAASIIQSVR